MIVKATVCHTCNQVHRHSSAAAGLCKNCGSARVKTYMVDESILSLSAIELAVRNHVTLNAIRKVLPGDESLV